MARPTASSATPDPRSPTWRAWHDEDQPIRLGVSSCLLGQEVRFDGGHKRDRYLESALAAHVEWHPVCPEVELGMGVPRPTLRLVEAGEAGDRLRVPDTGKDYTEEMARYARKRVRALGRVGLDGYILKRDSPSCGMERVKIYPAEKRGGAGRRDGRGHFARVLLDSDPTLPVEEEGRLNDAVLRESFIERIFARNRWRVLASRGLSRRRLVAFHAAHKMLLLAHNEAAYRRMGRIVASFQQRPDREVYAAYAAEFAAALRTRATPRKHVNVMQHMLGHLKRALPAPEKARVLAMIEDYRQGLVPLVVPLTLLRFLIDSHQVEYLQGQLYLEPHPRELMLRNHV
ncbi:MAG: YbgA family protein [Myxococcota bacterium]